MKLKKPMMKQKMCIRDRYKNAQRYLLYLRQIDKMSNYVEAVSYTHLLKAMLEWSVSDYPAAKGAFLQVSGLEFSFDPAKEAGSKVVEILVGGEAFDEAKDCLLYTSRCV